MRSFGPAVTAGVLGIAVLGFSAPGAVSEGVRARATSARVCGAERASRLAVSTGQATACSTAMEVASAYMRVARSAEKSVATVRVAGAGWKCQEQQGDPDPFLRCVSTADPSQWVELTS